MGRNLRGQRSEPDEIRSPRNDPLSGLNPLGYLNVVSFALAQSDGPSREGLALELDEHDRAAPVIHDCRRRHGRLWLPGRTQQPGESRLVDRQHPILIGGFVDHSECTCMGIYDASDRDEAIQLPGAVAARDLEFRLAELCDARELGLSHYRRHVHRVGIDDLEQSRTRLRIGAGHGVCLRD